MDPERKKQLEEKLVRMSQASELFYQNAVEIGVHSFVEITGLMNELINLYRVALTRDIDFAGTHVHGPGVALPMAAFNAAYIGEKMACIFGTSFSTRENWDAFVSEWDGVLKEKGKDEEIQYSTCVLNGKRIAYTNRSVFKVQVGKGAKGQYKTKARIVGDLPKAFTHYNGINLGFGYKKRLLMPGANRPVLARQFSLA